MWQRKKRKWLYVVSLVMMHTRSQSICILKKRIYMQKFILEKYVLLLMRNAVYININ